VTELVKIGLYERNFVQFFFCFMLGYMTGVQKVRTLMDIV